MRAMAIVEGFGLDHLKLIQRPIPEPRHTEVVIRISAVSLNYRDMDMVLGTYPFYSRCLSCPPLTGSAK